MTAYETIVDLLDDFKDGKALCPAHDDKTPSLSVDEGDNGHALVFCHAGCTTEAVVNALGLQMRDLFSQDRIPVHYYVYGDEDGNPLYRVVRFEPKSFAIQRWVDDGWEWGLGDARRVPYNLARVMEQTDKTIYICEGEKDADALAHHTTDVVATTLLGGAGKWRDEYSRYFAGRDVVIVADNDDAGRAGAQKVAQQIETVAASVRVRFPAFGNDLTDHLHAGYSFARLVEEGDGLDEFGPLDWRHYEIERTEWLLEPYIPRGGRVLAFGPAGSLKSLWSMWLGSKIAADGGRVAYFSLEMLPSITAQRLKQLDPPPENFLCFTRNFRLGSLSHTAKLVEALGGYDLIVFDSWTAVRAGVFKDSNESIAALDTEVFLPIIKQTGATTLVLDNTGHATMTDQGPVKSDHARGASAKGDKADVTLWFDRPYADNNYRCSITVKKMRYDMPIPKPVVIETPRDRIDFFYVSEGGDRTDRPMWPSVVLEDTVPLLEETTPREARAVARVRDLWGMKDG